MRGWILPFLLAAVGCGASTPSSPTPIAVTAPIVAADPAQFDATFNAQFVHDTFDSPSSQKPARLLASNPSIYVRSTGFSADVLAAMEVEARAVVPLLSGGSLAVATFTSGPAPRAESSGWIVVEQVNDPSNSLCGWANIGTPAGHVWFNTAHGDVCTRPLAQTFGHELGHALGFYHVADPSCLMSVTRSLTHNGAPATKSAITPDSRTRAMERTLQGESL